MEDNIWMATYSAFFASVAADDMRHGHNPNSERLDDIALIAADIADAAAERVREARNK